MIKEEVREAPVTKFELEVLELQAGRDGRSPADQIADAVRQRLISFFGDGCNAPLVRASVVIAAAGVFLFG